MPDRNEPADLEKSQQHCPACTGTGQFVLLTSIRPCDRCGGTGWIEPAGAEAPDSAVPWVYFTYDREGRVTSQSRAVARTITVFKYPDAEHEVGS